MATVIKSRPAILMSEGSWTHSKVQAFCTFFTFIKIVFGGSGKGPYLTEGGWGGGETGQSPTFLSMTEFCNWGGQRWERLGWKTTGRNGGLWRKFTVSDNKEARGVVGGLGAQGAWTRRNPELESDLGRGCSRAKGKRLPLQGPITRWRATWWRATKSWCTGRCAANGEGREITRYVLSLLCTMVYARLVYVSTPKTTLKGTHHHSNL